MKQIVSVVLVLPPQFQGRLVFRNEQEKARAARWGVTELDRKYNLRDLAHGEVMFAATGVTDGSMLPPWRLSLR